MALTFMLGKSSISKPWELSSIVCSLKEEVIAISLKIISFICEKIFLSTNISKCASKLERISFSSLNFSIAPVETFLIFFIIDHFSLILLDL